MRMSTWSMRSPYALFGAMTLHRDVRPRPPADGRACRGIMAACVDHIRRQRDTGRLMNVPLTCTSTFGIR